jgi:hypothetical protein
LAQEEVKPDLESLVAEIAREECKKLYEKRLIGLEEELVSLYRILDEVRRQWLNRRYSGLRTKA